MSFWLSFPPPRNPPSVWQCSSSRRAVSLEGVLTGGRHHTLQSSFLPWQHLVTCSAPLAKRTGRMVHPKLRPINVLKEVSWCCPVLLESMVAVATPTVCASRAILHFGGFSYYWTLIPRPITVILYNDSVFNLIILFFPLFLFCRCKMY